MKLSLCLKIARIEKELDQMEVQEQTGIAQSSISGIESGHVNAGYRTIEKLADCYGYELRIVKKGA
jgi:transcriptional regulator with XRE-family HTH domain